MLASGVCVVQTAPPIDRVLYGALSPWLPRARCLTSPSVSIWLPACTMSPSTLWATLPCGCLSQTRPSGRLRKHWRQSST